MLSSLKPENLKYRTSEEKFKHFHPKAYVKDLGRDGWHDYSKIQIRIPFLLITHIVVGEHISIPMAWDDAWCSFLKEKIKIKYPEYYLTWHITGWRLYNKYNGTLLCENVNTNIHALELIIFNKQKN